jgi:hypothetical protein
MTEYGAFPRGSASPFEPVVVALVAATDKTALQVAVPTTTDIRILGWGVSFDSASAAQPGWCQLVVTDYAATVTSLTPEGWGNPVAGASLCVGGAALTGYNSSGEGTPGTAIAVLDQQHVYPQSGYAVWFPDSPGGNQPRVGGAATRFVRIRCKFPAGVNVLPWLVWSEPSM